MHLPYKPHHHYTCTNCHHLCACKQLRNAHITMSHDAKLQHIRNISDSPAQHSMHSYPIAQWETQL